MQQKPLHILISPLDWGLGHASRCIPVIDQLIKAGHKVTIAGYGRSIILLQKEFPHLNSIEMQGFSPSYSKAGNMVLHLLMLLPHFMGSIFREHRNLKKLLTQYSFDIIISDNRYGFWNKQICSIFITHQVMIKTPAWLRFAEYPLYRISRMLICNFDECWIPDYKESPGLSGYLTHKYPLPKNAKFIGPLSRFQKPETLSDKKPDDVKITAIISGPEPQRSLFEDLIAKQLNESNHSSTIVSGKPESEKAVIANARLTILPHLSTAKMCSLISSSSLVICRSGYSSVMDLHVLGVKALFVPTPGQTEQIYLAELHQNAGAVLWREQESLNLKVDIGAALKFTGFIYTTAELSINATVADLKKK